MSSIDERIVKMQFDNKQFETGIQTSVKSLDNLKQGLNLEDSAKSLSNLEKVGKSFSLSGIANGVDTLVNKFSALGIVGVTALVNITNSAINAGKNLVSSLTIDPIKKGLDEYETKMNSITTILTNTQSKGTTIDQVNTALNELNTYADKTIYNFAEMTRNIGTFTAAGVDLKTSTTSIKGIANLAAGSGSSALQASTAMYQLSQAISSGAVKLQDWNSVVNAGMGGELFQKALEKTAKELGKGRDMSVSFRESLESGWITTDVLTKTLAKFANDESLLKAATQVKTFTQLLDTMKESIQSGWAQTWETIIGNKDEAAKMFTSINDAFSSIIGSSADARNSMLSFWKANGGRDAIIKAITNAFNALQSILKPISDGFKEIFPPMTGEKLVAISKSIEKLSENFWMWDENIMRLKWTFQGLFAILDIIKQAIFAVGGGVLQLIKSISPASDGILKMTGNMGLWLVSLDETIKKTGIFNVAIEKIGSVIKVISDGIKISIDTIIDVFKSLGAVDTSGLDSFSERVKVRLEPFSKLGELVEKAFNKIANVLEKTAPIFYKLASIIGKAFDKLRTNIVQALDNADFNSIFDIVNGGLFVGIIFGIKKFIDSISALTNNTGGFLKGITGTLDGVKGSLEAFQSSLKAGTLLKIAIAIGILSASLVALSLIDSEKLTIALAAMTGMFVELFGSMAIFEKIMGSTGFKSMAKITTSMIALSLAILILSSAMTKLSKLDWDGLTKGLLGVAALSTILVKSVKALSSGSKGLIKASIGLILFAEAINILVSAVEKLGKIDTESLIKGLLGVGALVTELALFMKLSDFSGFGIGKGLGLLALSAAILVLATAVKKMSEIDTGALIKGLSAMAVVLTEIALFTKITGDSKKVISTAIGITILGAAMLIMAEAIEKMGSLSMEQIGKGLLTLAVSLSIAITALQFMPKNIIGKAMGLVVMATSLLILANAISVMGGMTWEEIAKGLVTLAGSLTIITVAMAFMKTALPGAAALLVISGALAILAPTLVTLGKMNLTEIGKGLLAIAGIFAVIGVAGLLLAPLTPVILALSGAIALFGLGCVAVGAGMLAFSAGLSALAISGTAGAAALVAVVTSIVGLIPFVLITLAKGIVDFARVIGEGAPVIAGAILKVLSGITLTIIAVTPDIMKALTVLLTSLLETIVTMVPKMVEAGMKLILGVLKGIADNIADVTSAGIEVILQFIRGVTSKLPDIIDTALNLIITFINGLAEGIRNNHQALYNAISNLLSAVTEAIVDFIPSMVGMGANLIKGFIRGISSMFSSLGNAVDDIGESAVNGLKKVLGIHSPSKVFEELGKYSIEGFAVGLDRFSGISDDAAKNAGSSAIDSMKGAIANISDVINGNLDVVPTIRPVIDLTNVTSGVNSINSLLNGNKNLTISTANIKTPSIGVNNKTVNTTDQNGSTDGSLPTTSPVTPRPAFFQLVLPNGKAIAEFITDDLDGFIGNKSVITGRAIGV